MAASGTRAKPPIAEIDFERQPFILAWELTRACNLACVHCRAEAQLKSAPGELNVEEAHQVIDEIASFDVPPVLILTGGDPMRRTDLVSLVEYATEQGIRCTVTPAGTPLASPRRLAELRDAGVARIAVSLDGPSPVEHDDFRKVTGSFKWTMDIIQHAADLGIELQMHTTLCRRTLPYMAEMADLADRVAPAVWAVFCLVPTGRAMVSEELTADEYEQVFNWLLDRQQGAPWDLKLTEGYHFRRLVQQRAGSAPANGPGFMSGPVGSPGGVGRAPKTVNSGNGFCFISHTGDISPSGFLPIVTGNVRRDSLVETYRTNPIFRELRDPSRLIGKCGGCRYREICGGSRSRAYAHYGDYLASDPACAYLPQGDG